MSLFQITGNCFIDAGIFVLLNFTKEKEPENLKLTDLV